MKDLYVWLQHEVQVSIELLDNEIITDEVQKTVFSSSKEYLEKSKPVLGKLIAVLTENELDVMTLINLIAKLKAKTSDSDEDEILQSMILKMLEISSLKPNK